MQRFKTILFDKKQLTQDVFLLSFGLVEPDTISFIPGQCLILNIPHGGNFKKRPYSIASADHRTHGFELLIKHVIGGVGSEYLINLKKDGIVLFDGPIGVFCLQKEVVNAVFLVTGTGIAPVRSMLYWAQYAKPQVQKMILYWGLPTINDVFLYNELKGFEAKIPSFQFKIFLSQEKNIDSNTNNHICLGRMTVDFDDLFKHSLPTTNYYICGSRGVVESIKQIVLARGVAPTNTHYEKF